MKTPPPLDRIASEIAGLEALRHHVREFSLVGDDNHAAIDAQVLVLRDRIGAEEATKRAATDPADDYVLGCAVIAVEWLAGNLDDNACPCAGWGAP